LLLLNSRAAAILVHYLRGEQVKGKVVPVHAIKVYSESGSVSRILLTSALRGVVKFMHQPFYPWERTQVAVQSKFCITVKMYFWEQLKAFYFLNTVPSPHTVICTCFTNLTKFQILFLNAVFPCQQTIASNTDLGYLLLVLLNLTFCVC
jgi:hypothetical protein